MGAQTREKNRVLAPVLCVCAAGVGRHNGCNHLNIYGEEEGGRVIQELWPPPFSHPID